VVVELLVELEVGPGVGGEQAGIGRFFEGVDASQLDFARLAGVGAAAGLREVDIGPLAGRLIRNHLLYSTVDTLPTHI
jgi:hypothetical protein